MPEVVVTGTADFVALDAVVVFIAADPDGVLEAGEGALILYRLLLVAGVYHPFVDAALNQKLLIWKQDK